MWFFTLSPSIFIKNRFKHSNIFFIYNNIYKLFLTTGGCKKWNGYVYTNKYLLINHLFYLIYETTIISIKYIGKIFRIERYKKKFKLLMHYPGKTYLIYKNIKWKWIKKKKRRLVFHVNTNKNIKTMFFKNLLKLRMPNTYTKRGIYNNLFTYFSRKRKITNTR
jgi:hypothetical protein